MGKNDGASWHAAWQAYHTLIVAERVAFPTRYVIAHISEAVRTERLLARERARGLDEARAQRKLQRYRTFAENQLRYWHALAQHFPAWVHFVETAGVAANTATLRALAARPTRRHRRQLR